MVTISDVWDRTTEVLAGRGTMMGGIAALALFLPSVIRDALTLVMTPGSTGFAAIFGVASIVAVVIMLWGQLAMLAAAADPATTRAAAMAQASARLPASLAVALVMGLVVVVVLLPLVVAIAMSGVDFANLTRAGTVPNIPGGVAAFALVYLLALFVVAIGVGARLILVNPVVLNDRLGLRAIAQSWRLTRGLTWKLIGVLILYAIVVGIAAIAAQFVAGAVFGLILDDPAVVTFLAAVVVAVVSAVFSVIAAAFTAQLYVAITRRGVATVFE